MAIVTFILGRSGTGKSTSIETLDPNSTVILNVLGKALPFKGYKGKYTPLVRKELTGNLFSSDQASHIKTAVNHINDDRPDIKVIVIDDFHYIMSNHYFSRANESGYNKFVQIGAETVELLNLFNKCRDDLYFFLMWHSELSSDGTYNCKTIGKMIEEKDTPEGRATVVLHTEVRDKKYRFLTNTDGVKSAKSPAGMFIDMYIPNDLQMVINAMNEYYN